MLSSANAGDIFRANAAAKTNAGTAATRTTFISFVIQRSLGGVDAAGVDGLIIFSVRREHAAADDGYGIEQVEQLSYAAGFRVPAYRVVFIKGGSDKARCGGVVAGQADCAKALAKGRQGTYGVISKPILRIFGGEVQILA